ncbi:zinc ribbon domain-containing protein [Rhodosalinus sp. 5P4]|uniref:zinc ribbon domain-containing protein n=1 Tax=Rhodosalinus sp. 5P4 TaxID=3239196 RepID=UPI0035258450
MTTGPILLTGIVTCGHCGAGMTITTGKGGRYKYYTCASLTRTGAGSCDNKRVPMAELDDFVTDQIIRKLLSPERTTRVLEGLLKRQSAREVEKTGNLRRLREKLNSAQARLDRYYDLIDAGTLDPAEPTLKDRIEAAATERDLAKVALDRMASELSPATRVTEENVAALADLLKKNITTGTIEFRRSYLRAVIKEIQVSQQRVRIVAKPSEFERMALTLNQDDLRVPSFVPGWRSEWSA